MARAGLLIGWTGGTQVTAALACVSLALAACTPPVGPDSIGPVGAEPKAVAGYTAMNGPAGALIVKRAGQPFTYADGAEARTAADKFCGPDGVASGDLDNFRDDAWVFPGGCV